MTKLIMSSALQISMSAIKSILNFNPKDYNYHIPDINTQLNHLLVLDNNNTDMLYSEEQLQNIITAY